MSWYPQYSWLGAISRRFGFEVATNTVAKRGVIIYEGYAECKSIKQLGAGKVPARGKIVSFSKKSRIRVMKFMASIKDSFQVFQTFTFPDDVMEGKTVAERSAYCQKVKSRFLKRIKRRYPDFKAVIRKEWKPRQSGVIKGELCPHLHMIYLCLALGHVPYKTFCREIGLLWIESLHTVEKEKAKAANLNDDCFKWLETQLMARQYVSKYVAKVDDSEGDQYQGRTWYLVGKFNIPAPEWQALSDQDNIRLRRLLRGYMKPRNHHVAKSLRRQDSNTFMFIQRKTVHRMLEWVIQQEYRSRSPALVEAEKPLLKDWWDQQYQHAVAA